MSLSVGTHLFVGQLLSEIGSCFRNILLVGTVWRQFLRKFWFLLVLNINNTKKTPSLNVSKLSFISIGVIAYLYIQTYHPILRHFELQMAAIFTYIGPHFGRVNVGYKFLQTFGKSTVHLQGLFILFPSIFHSHPNCQFC